MAYTKKTWEDYPSTNTLVTASDLNRMEDGIANANTEADKKLDSPTTSGTVGQVLKLGASGTEWGNSVTVDSALSDTSENPVQNKVVKSAIDEKLVKPAATGTKGQVLTLGNSGATVWEDIENTLTYTKEEYEALATKPAEGTHVVITNDGTGTGASSSVYVSANPSESATETLQRLKVNNTVYSIPSQSESPILISTIEIKDINPNASRDAGITVPTGYKLVNAVGNNPWINVGINSPDSIRLRNFHTTDQMDITVTYMFAKI